MVPNFFDSIVGSENDDIFTAHRDKCEAFHYSVACFFTVVLRTNTGKNLGTPGTHLLPISGELY